MEWNRHYALGLAIVIGLLVVCVYQNVGRTTEENGEEAEAEIATQLEVKLVDITQGEWEERLYEQYEMNQQRGFRRHRHLFWWVQVVSEEDRQKVMQTYQVDIPELDFDSYYYLISFGKELSGVRYYGKKPTKSGGLYTEVDIDFSDNHPSSDIMLETSDGGFIQSSELKAKNVYIYAMDKIILMDTCVDNETLIYLNYNYTEKNLVEMPITYIDKVKGEWEKYEGFEIYTYNNGRKLRHEGVAWWYQIYGDWEWYQEIFHVQGSPIELGDGEYIISLGREIEHLWYSAEWSDHGYGKEHYAKVAFNMDNYDSYAIYIYKLEHEIDFIDTTLEDWELKKFNFIDVYEIIEAN